ncbi:hypothetical protein VTO42DRAFT_1721 [Malbranchea cinnamomea]
MHCNGNGAVAPYKVLVIGGSYGGLAATVNLLDLCHGKPCRFTGETELPEPREKIPVQITIVDERDGFYHLIGTPLAFAAEEYAQKAWIKFRDIPALQTPEVRIIRGSATEVDCGKKTCTIREADSQNQRQESYDYLVAASGLRRTWPSAPRSLTHHEYLAETTKHIHQARDAREGVVVIGGGAVGIEMAAELKLAQPEQKVTLVHSRPKLVSSEPLPDEFKDKTLEALRQAGVETILDSRVTRIAPGENGASILTLASGRQIRAGHVIDAISRSSPTTSYLPAAALNKEGYVKINSQLNFAGDVPNAHCHYAAGDITLWPAIRRAGGAMYHGHYAAMNIHQRMLHERFGTPPKFVELMEPVPTICLAIANSAVGYSPDQGVISGEDVLQLYFNDDLGFKICWNYLGLGNPATA